MVKILSVHHFLNEDVQPLDKSSSCTICSAYDNLLLVAGEHRIDAFDLKDGPVIRHNFPTIDYVEKIAYSTVGNYVCTLERKSEEEGEEQTYVRVYFRWDAYSENKPMKARIAGMVSPRGENDSEILEMLEVPTTTLITSIAVCDKTGNLCLSSGSAIHVYKFCEKVSTASKLIYYDFDHILETEMCFEIEEIIMAESIIGCLCATEVQVFEIIVDFTKKSKSKNDLNIETFEKCSSKIMEINSNSSELDEFMDMEETRWVATINGSRSCNSDNYMLYPSLVGGDCNCCQLDRNETFSKDAKPFVSCFQPSAGENAKHFTQNTLLHKKLAEMEKSLSPFSNLNLIQYFATNSGVVAEGVKTHPLMSSREDTHRIGTTVFFASRMDGNFFHICEDGQVMTEASYVFTADVIKVSLESHIIHVMTNTGLESYMIRPHPCILDDAPGGKIAVPLSFNKSVNVIGLRPFRNVLAVSLTRDFLAVLFNEMKEGENELNLCSLKLQSPTELFSEVVRVASNHPDLSPTNSLELLLEGYLALLTAAASNYSSTTTDYSVHTRHACELLAKYFLRENSAIFWKEGIKFFLTTGAVLSDFVKGLSEEIAGKEFFLKEILLWPDAPKLEHDEAEEIIGVCSTVLPNSFANIILHSKCLREYRGTKILNSFGNEDQVTNTEEIVAICITCVNTLPDEKIKELLEKVQKQELISMLEENVSLLVKFEMDKIELTYFSKFMVKYKNEIFNELISNCVNLNHLSLDSITAALTASFPIYSCDMECNANYIKLRDLVETYYKKYGRQQQRNSQSDYNQSISMMISLYLASLLGAFKKEDSYAKTCQRANNIDIYGSRQSYLDMLPPFNGEIVAVYVTLENKHPPIKAEKCYCQACAVDMLLLQSLLLSNLPTENDRDTVATFARNNMSYPWSDTLIIIANQSNRISAIVSQFPKAILQYVKDTCKSTEDWKNSVKEIINAFEETHEDSQLKNILDDVLFEAATVLLLEDFVDAVPPEKYESCKHQIDFCHRCSLANRLKEIMDEYSNAFLDMNKTIINVENNHY